MITLKTFVFNDFQENTYILHDETSKCIIIDPGCNNKIEQDTLTSYIKENQLIPQAVVNSHCHIDHVLGCKYVCEQYNIPFIAHKEDSFLLQNALEFGVFFGIKANQPPMPDNYLSDGDTYPFGESLLKIFHVPGHSLGSIVLYSEADKILITGDVLFRGSIGRTDLPGGNFKILIEGINSKLLTLPENTMVFPGHGPYTTIGEEKKNNPFLQ